MATQITHASQDERSKFSGGSPGNQTSKEVVSRTWYNADWNQVLRYQDESVAKNAALLAEKLASSKLVGYDQGDRITLYNALKKNNWNVDTYISSGELTETDCSAFVFTVYCCLISQMRNESYPPSTKTLANIFTKYGFKLITDSEITHSKDYLTVGDLVRKEGHVIMVTSIDGEPKTVSEETFTQNTNNTTTTTNNSYKSNTSNTVSNTVINLSNSNKTKKDVLVQSEDRKNEFEKLFNTLVDNAPQLGREIIKCSELYDSSILKVEQTSKYLNE